MSVSQKTTGVHAYRLMVYRRALHPELFAFETRRVDRHGEYEAESWLCAGGHVIRFNFAGEVLTETVVDTGDHLPEHGLVHALPCLGEKEYQLEPDDDRIMYFTTVQTETLPENLYKATLQELIESADETGAVSHAWSDTAGDNLSMIEMQKYKREFHVQGYHLHGGTGSVLRTLSIFETLA